MLSVKFAWIFLLIPHGKPRFFSRCFHQVFAIVFITVFATVLPCGVAFDPGPGEAIRGQQRPSRGHERSWAGQERRQDRAAWARRHYEHVGIGKHCLCAVSWWYVSVGCMIRI